jgi:hypothetical protein
VTGHPITPADDSEGRSGEEQTISRDRLILLSRSPERLEAVLKELPPEHRKALKAYLEQLRQRSEGKGNPKPGEAKGPRIWHRDRARPTFARVYVGDGNSLELVSLHVSVTVEGPRARTVVDHIFHNPHDKQLEGTFEYPLPTGASPSYFAMFLGQARDTLPPLWRGGKTPTLPGQALAPLTPEQFVSHVDTEDWGQLQRARIVPQQRGREAYENIVRGKIDPALLEYAGGNTFQGRVFPIPAKGYNRVVLAYEELLPIATGQQVYRFPLPGRKLKEMTFTLHARKSECQEPTFLPKKASHEEKADFLIYRQTWKDASPEGEVLFTCRPAHPDIQAITGTHNESGGQYLYARLRPAFSIGTQASLTHPGPEVDDARPFASHAIFLLDISQSEGPDRFAVSMQLLRKILETDPDIRHFNILTFNVGSTWVEPAGWLPNTPAGREKAWARLDGLVLEGATDLSCALNQLQAPSFDIKPGTPVNVFLLSDGHITWGEEDVTRLAGRFEKECPFPVRFHCYRTGLGQENTELFQALTRRGGGIFQCYGEAQVEATARAHRSQCLEVQSVRFEGIPTVSDVLIAGRQAALYPGGELILSARVQGMGPLKVILEGTFRGEKVRQEFPLEISYNSSLAPRAWGELAVNSLLALHDPGLDSLVTAYCQEFGIACRVASFLVLENETDYKRLDLYQERNKTLTGDVAEYLQQAWAQRAKPISDRQRFQDLLARVDQATGVLTSKESRVRELLQLLREEDFTYLSSPLLGELLHRKEVGKDYLSAREKDRSQVLPYLAEARRRMDRGDAGGALRALSGVIEEHPRRSDALRLVAYRLLDLEQPAQAANLFQRVLHRRPFEPQSYRDLALSLAQAGMPGLAALYHETVLAGKWPGRFCSALHTITREEYVTLLQDSLNRGGLRKDVAAFFRKRLKDLASQEDRSDLRVTISWNTDATDVDLWVIEPDGTKVYYEKPTSSSGGMLSEDLRQGYGPERYRIAHASRGTYRIVVHSFATNPNLLAGQTHVHVVVTRNAGSANAVTERYTVVLSKQGEEVKVCQVKF